MTYEKDRNWSDKYLEQVAAILKKNASDLIVISIAPDEIDRTGATDMIIRIDGGDVAVRLRRDNCTYRDLTIRSKRASGYKTELSKILEGFGDWYLYGWTNVLGIVDEWIIVSLIKLRNSGLLIGRKDISNYDGTFFIAISAKELIEKECLVSWQLK